MTTMVKKETENKAILYRLTEELWMKHNLSIFEEVYASDVVYHGPSIEIHGRDDLKNLTRSYLTAFPDMKVTMRELLVEEDMVAFRYNMEAVHKGKLQEIPPTGKKIKLTGIIIQRFSKGKVVEEWEEYDQLGMMKQLGMELRPMELIH